MDHVRGFRDGRPVIFRDHDFGRSPPITPPKSIPRQQTCNTFQQPVFCEFVLPIYDVFLTSFPIRVTELTCLRLAGPMSMI
jgi:hypothetical protein